jgi:hypothetical protein
MNLPPTARYLVSRWEGDAEDVTLTIDGMTITVMSVQVG